MPIVLKRPREKPLVDREPKFEPLGNLHLELLENRKKLKKDVKAPPKPVIKPIVVEQPKPVVIEKEVADSRRASDVELSNDEGDEKDEPHRREVVESDSELDEINREMNKASRPGSSSDPAAGDKTSSGDKAAASADGKESAKKDGDDEPATEEEPEEEESEEKQHQEYLWRFTILKKKLRGSPREKDVPAYNEYSDLNTMKTTYARLVRDIEIDDNADGYESWLMMGSYAMQWVVTNILKMDFEGFAAFQLASRNKYRPLLIELGERPYAKWSTSFPVEVRLLFMLITQACFFMIVKWSERNQTPAETRSLRVMLGAAQPEPAPTAGEPAKKKGRKMHGPRINVDDVKSEGERPEKDAKE